MSERVVSGFIIELVKEIFKIKTAESNDSGYKLLVLTFISHSALATAFRTQ